jgi:WD40 repeat protein
MIMPIGNSKDLFSRLNSKEFSGHKKKVYSVAWNFNGNKLASGSADSNIRVIKIFIYSDLEL